MADNVDTPELTSLVVLAKYQVRTMVRVNVLPRLTQCFVDDDRDSVTMKVAMGSMTNTTCTQGGKGEKGQKIYLDT